MTSSSPPQDSVSVTRTPSADLSEKGFKKPEKLDDGESAGGCPILLKSGSVASSSFSLAKATLGAGALALASTFKSVGPVIAISLLVVMYFITVWSIEAIAIAAEKTKKDTYEEIVDSLFGSVWSYVVEVVVILFSYGTCVAYMIAICNIIAPVVQHYIPNPETWYQVLVTDRTWFTLVVTVTIMLPLSLCRSINSVRYVSFLGVMCVCFLAVTTLYLVLRYGVSDTLTDNFSSHLFPEMTLTGVLSAVNTYMFAYCGHNNVPQVHRELSNRCYERMSKVASFSMLICFGTYVLVGTCGYLHFGTEIKDLTDSLPIYVTGSPDAVVILALSMMCFAVIGAFPLNIFPIRNSVEMFLDSRKHGHIVRRADDDDDSMYSPRSIIITVVTVALSFVGAVTLPNIDTVLELVGAGCGSIITFLAPGMFNLALARKNGEKLSFRAHGKYFLLTFLGVVTFFLGTYCAVLGAIDAFAAQSA